MKNIHISTPNEDGSLRASLPLIYTAIKTKRAIEIDLEEKDGYAIRLAPLESLPKAGVKILGEASIGCKQGLCMLKRGNPLLPIALRIQKIRFSHKALMTFRKDTTLAGWAARNLFMHLRRKGPIDVWARDHCESAHKNPLNAIQFASRYIWFVKDGIDEAAWNSRSRDALVEVSSVLGLDIFCSGYTKLASKELMSLMLPPDDHLEKELELKLQISRNLATAVIWGSPK